MFGMTLAGWCRLTVALALAGCSTGPQAAFVPLGNFALAPAALASPAAVLPSAAAPVGPVAPTSGAHDPPPSQALAVPTPDAMPSVVDAPPASGGESTGGTGSFSTSNPTGRVVGVVANHEVPVAGATVLTSNGQRVTTDANGVYVLAGGVPTDGLFVVSAHGFLTSVTSGLDTGALPTLHLKSGPGQAAAPTQDPFADLPFTATGKVVDANGNGIVGVAVVLQDAAGSVSDPAITVDDGTFTTFVHAIDRTVTNGSWLAVGVDGVHVLGVATGVNLTPTSAASLPITVQPCSQPLTVTVDASHITAPVTSGLVVMGPNGQRYILSDANGDYLLADVPGVKYAIQADAFSADGTSFSSYHHEIGTASQVPQTLSVSLLGIPGAPRVSNGSLGWDGVQGAAGYQVTLGDPAAHATLWEGFTATSSLAFPGLSPGAGNYLVTLEADDEAGLSARGLASLAGPRTLRVLPQADSYRVSSRQTTLTF